VKTANWTVKGGSLALFMALGLSVLNCAQADEQVIIDYRQGVMKAIGGNMSSLAAVIVDGAEYRDNLVHHARFIAEFLQDVPALFPEGSDFGETDALEGVWTKREEFEKRAAETREAADLLLQAVETGDDAMALRFRELGESCRACHEDFRRSD
jgi:cytochrome c556